MKFDPKSAEELVAETLLPAGTYPFEVIAASDEFSKAGNEMIKLKLSVFGNDGDAHHVFDYLLEKLAFKLRHFAETTGLLKDYEKGELTAFACNEKAGYVKISIEDSPGYGAKNVVKDYVVPASDAKPAPAKPAAKANPARPVMNAAHKASMNAQAPAAAPFNDDIPF